MDVIFAKLNRIEGNSPVVRGAEVLLHYQRFEAVTVRLRLRQLAPSRSRRSKRLRRQLERFLLGRADAHFALGVSLGRAENVTPSAFFSLLRPCRSVSTAVNGSWLGAARVLRPLAGWLARRARIAAAASVLQRGDIEEPIRRASQTPPKRAVSSPIIGDGTVLRNIGQIVTATLELAPP